MFEDKYSDRAVNTIPHFDELKSMIEENDFVLDLGCGVGNVVEYLSDKCKGVWGVTYNMEEVEEGRKRGRNISYEDAHNIRGFDDNFLDKVIMWDVLEHVTAPLTVLEEVHRILKTGGQLLLYIPSERWIETPYHIIVPNIRQTTHLARLAGFVVEEVRVKEEQAAIYVLQKE